MKKSYTAVYLLNPKGATTKDGFISIGAAKCYIQKQAKKHSKYKRSNWLVVESRLVEKVGFENLQEQTLEDLYA